MSVLHPKEKTTCDSNPIERQLSPQAVLVAQCVMKHPKIHGYKIKKITKLKAGTIYFILKRMEQRNLMCSEWQRKNIPNKQVFWVPDYAIQTLEKEIENTLTDLALREETYEL